MLLSASGTLDKNSIFSSTMFAVSSLLRLEPLLSVESTGVKELPPHTLDQRGRTPLDLFRSTTEDSKDSKPKRNCQGFHARCVGIPSKGAILWAFVPTPNPCCGWSSEDTNANLRKCFVSGYMHRMHRMHSMHSMRSMHRSRTARRVDRITPSLLSSA